MIFLQFAVLTGCLRISKESIFTGLNNFEVLSILNVQYDECFGFTDTEVKKILSDYNLSDHYLQIREWYDGYRFGNVDIYCPWDVINYVDRIKDDPGARPEAFWINTSGNFSNTEECNFFWKAVEEGNTEGIEKYLNRVLSNSVSVFDTKARNEEKESSYHNLLVGILTGNADWLIKSNIEAGEGFADIVAETDDPDSGIIVELKYTKEFERMEQACQKAIAQNQKSKIL